MIAEIEGVSAEDAEVATKNLLKNSLDREFFIIGDAQKMKYTVLVKLHKDFLKINGDTITIGVMARPVKGKANEEVIVKIAKYFHIPSSRVKIIAGATSKRKIVEVE